LPEEYVAVKLERQIVDRLRVAAKEFKVKDASAVANLVLSHLNIREKAKEILCTQQCIERAIDKIVGLHISPAEAAGEADSCIKRCIWNLEPP
jgi:hydroxylamine reductase (hybrid-cluster protein)